MLMFAEDDMKSTTVRLTETGIRQRINALSAKILKQGIISIKPIQKPSKAIILSIAQIKDSSIKPA